MSRRASGLLNIDEQSIEHSIILDEERHMIAFDGKLKMMLVICFILSAIIMLIILKMSIFELVDSFANWVRETRY